MTRGIVFGAFWGLFLGGMVLAIASLLGNVPSVTSPTAKQLEVPAGSEFDQAGVDSPVAPPTEDPPVLAPDNAPLVTAPVAPVAPTLGGEVTAPAAIPQTGDVNTLAPPPAGAASSGVELRAEVAPVDDESVSDDAVTAEIAPPAPEAPPDTQVTAPAAPLPVQAEAPEPVKPAEETETVAPEAPEPEVAEAPEPAPAPTPEEATEELATPEAPPADTEETLEVAQADAAPVEEPASPRPQANSAGFGNLADGVTVNRLTDTERAAAEEASVEAGEDPDTAAPDDPRPVAQFAQTEGWAGPDDRPLFSLVIIDEAGDASLMGALASFDAPLTFAVPASKATATAATARYREAGHEVVLIADLPEGAEPSDIEVVMEAQLQAVPEAVAVLDGSLSGFRGDREVAEQMASILAATGHGLLTLNQGLNTADQLAARSGVPTGTIYRDLDGEGQTNTVIRRFLDQAAFRADQDGSAILLARLRPETISALLIWHQQERAQRVNIAPLSAQLLGTP